MPFPARFLTPDRYPIVYDQDALDLVDLKGAGRIAMVGAFIPFLKVFKTIPNLRFGSDRRKREIEVDAIRFLARRWRKPPGYCRLRIR